MKKMVLLIKKEILFCGVFFEIYAIEINNNLSKIAKHYFDVIITTN